MLTMKNRLSFADRSHQGIGRALESAARRFALRIMAGRHRGVMASKIGDCPEIAGGSSKEYSTVADTSAALVPMPASDVGGTRAHYWGRRRRLCGSVTAKGNLGRDLP